LSGLKMRGYFACMVGLLERSRVSAITYRVSTLDSVRKSTYFCAALHALVLPH
jgi:hypothetical protein